LKINYFIGSEYEPSESEFAEEDEDLDLLEEEEEDGIVKVTRKSKPSTNSKKAGEKAQPKRKVTAKKACGTKAPAAKKKKTATTEEGVTLDLSEPDKSDAVMVSLNSNLVSHLIYIIL
jgi:hypothetical protein